MSRRRQLHPAQRRRMTRAQKVGVASAATLVGVAAIGIVAGLLLDRLLDFDGALDAGGSWDLDGSTHTRWE